jgi:hypothetical protein
VSDNEGAVFMRVRSMSLPLACTRATARDRTRCGQGWKGYDTTHDTKFRASARGPGRQLSDRAGAGCRRRLFASGHTLRIFYFFFATSLEARHKLGNAYLKRPGEHFEIADADFLLAMPNGVQRYSDVRGSAAAAMDSKPSRVRHSDAHYSHHSLLAFAPSP